jgi:N-methylhydantoinase B
MLDAVEVEVWRHLVESIADEMGATLERTAYSPNIKERRDHSCALFDRDGRLLAQAAHIPVHLGAMPAMMEALRTTLDWPRGVMWLCNDPAHGGTHLPDLTMVAPVYSQADPSRLIGFVANRAHHADVGGMAPGSLPLSRELVQEGLILPPLRVARGGRLQEDVIDLVCANSRTPKERKGDLAAQFAANQVGARRMMELEARMGEDAFRNRAEAARIHARTLVEQSLRQGTDGVYTFQDILESDGLGAEGLTIRVTVELRDGRIRFDFAGTSKQTPGPVNATLAVTRAACYYTVLCLVGEALPINAGALEGLEVDAPEGTLVNAGPSAAVSGGNVETSQRITDVALGALAKAFPGRIPAASQGTMNNLLIGGYDPVRGHPFAYYETIAGGAGACPNGNGSSAIHTHMTNTRNTPIEELERHYPLRVKEYSIRRGSGGAGTNTGGDGVVRTVELLADATVSIISERRTSQPYGLEGGEPGCSGINRIVHPDGTLETVDAKFSSSLPAGTTIEIETPGGGGYGGMRSEG